MRQIGEESFVEPCPDTAPLPRPHHPELGELEVSIEPCRRGPCDAAARESRSEDADAPEYAPFLPFLAAIERGAATIPSPREAPFRMTIEDVFKLGTGEPIVAGTVERGSVATGMAVEVVGRGSDVRRATVTRIQTFQGDLEEAKAGDNVWCCLAGIAREAVLPGQVLAAPGSCIACALFSALVVVPSLEEARRSFAYGGAYTAPPLRHETERYQFSFQTTRHLQAGRVFLPVGIAEVRAEDEPVEIMVILDEPTVIEPGTHFRILRLDPDRAEESPMRRTTRSSDTVGFGQITQVFG